MRAALLALLLLAIADGLAGPLDVPHYAIGDRAESDVFTPLPLVVFDAARTETLRQAEARKVAPVFRYLTNSVRQAEDRLRSAFGVARSQFVGELESRFEHPVPLLNSELAQPDFGEIVQTFGARNPDFPLSRQLAELWALGDPGDLILDSWVRWLPPWSGRYIQTVELPRSEPATTGAIRLVTTAGTGSVITLAEVDKRGRNLPRTNLVSLTKVQADALKEVSPQDRPAARFAMSFLGPSCVFDEELTRQARARRVEPINAADHYSAGQRLIAKGEVVSAPIKRALDQLRERTEANRLEIIAAARQAEVSAQAARARQAAATVEMARRANRWLLGGLGVAIGGCVLLTALWWKRRNDARNARRSGALVLAGSHAEDLTEAEWRERAVAAEARAEKATALLRSRLMPHFAHWMMNEVVHRLVSQRSESHTAQQQAQREVAELAQRLAELQTPLEERLTAYERRIAELEAELASKGEQNLELIKAKIETTRKRLEGERGRLDWN